MDVLGVIAFLKDQEPHTLETTEVSEYDKLLREGH